MSLAGFPEELKQVQQVEQDTRKNVLVVGEHPLTFSGNGNMMGAILDEIDIEQFNISCFLYGDVSAEQLIDPFWQFPFPVIPAHDQSENDPWGKRKLLEVIQYYNFDIVLFVGIDIWRYVEGYDYLSQMVSKKDPRPVWKAVVPYDLHTVRNDWIRWFKYPDQIFVYSEYGYEILSHHIGEEKHVEYFRPPLRYKDVYRPAQDKLQARKLLFPQMSEETTLFTFVGFNQIRKNIPRMIKGYSLAANKVPNMALYVHMENPFDGVYNLKQLASDYETPEGGISYKMGRKLLPEEMALVYQASDCYVNFSMQEGLSWTVIEAMRCGLPLLLSNSTAHMELYNNNGIFVAPDETSFVPLMTDFGRSYVESRACAPERIAKAFETFMRADQEKRDEWALNSLNKANEWLEGCHDINDILNREFVAPVGEEVKGELI